MASQGTLLGALVVGWLLPVRGQKRGGYDCESGYTHWQKTWTVPKRRWCCSYVQRGCADARLHQEIFDCEDSLTTWRDAWSPEKKDWCCENSRWSDIHQGFCCRRGKGCHSGFAFNCQYGSEGLWSGAKQQWCCKYEPPYGCGYTSYTTSRAFDCQAGLARARDGWSRRKKSWCCKQEKLGCSVTTTRETGHIHLPPGMHFLYHKLREEHGFHLPSRKPREEHIPDTDSHSGESPPPGWNGTYDCDSGLAQQASWEKGKICYCCRHYGIACPPVYYPPLVPPNGVVVCDNNADLSRAYEVNSDTGTQTRESRLAEELPARPPAAARVGTMQRPPLGSMGGMGPGLLAPPMPAGGLPPNMQGGFPPAPGAHMPPIPGGLPQNFMLSLPPGATQGGFQLGGCGSLPNFGPPGGLPAALGAPPGMPGTSPLGMATQMGGSQDMSGGSSNPTLAALLSNSGSQDGSDSAAGHGGSVEALLQRSQHQSSHNEHRNSRHNDDDKQGHRQQQQQQQQQQQRRGDQREQEIREARERIAQAESQKCHLHKKAKSGCKFCKKHQELLENAKDKANELAGRGGRDRRRGRRPDRAISEDREAEGRRGPLEIANPKTFGFSGLLQTHVVECAHFKSLLTLETFDQLVDETYQFANSVEPYMANSGTLPSALFCCLYRFFTLGLDGRQLRRLIDSQESPYIRCCGFLYVRFGLPHEQVLSWLGEYVLDDEEFKPSPDSEWRTTVGEYVEGLLSQDKYYNTVLPRLPMVTKRHVEERLAPLGQNRKRMKANKEIIDTFREPGTKIEANIGGDWLPGTLIELEEDIPTRPKVRVRMDDGSEEYVHIGKVILSERGRRSRSRGRRGAGAVPGGVGAVGGGPGGGGGPGAGAYGRSRSRSPKVDWSRDKGRSDRELVDELRNREREKAVCSSGKDYARKPVGYKAACALPREQGAASYRLMEEETFVPMSRQPRARTPSPERDARGRRPSAEHQARMQQLFEKYGNAKGSTEERRTDDGVDRPDVMRLG